MQINVPYNPPITLPVSGSGGCVVDVRGMVIATCPNSQVADALANIINDYANDRGLMLPPMSACFPYGAPEPGQRNADDMGYPPPAKKPR
jgi:hypothetical protein